MTSLSATFRKFCACTHNIKVRSVKSFALRTTLKAVFVGNVWFSQVALVWSLFETGSASVRSGAVLSAYIYLCTNSNGTVGYVQGVTGIAQVEVAPHLHHV